MQIDMYRTNKKIYSIYTLAISGVMPEIARVVYLFFGFVLNPLLE